MGKSHTKIVIKNNVRIYISDFKNVVQDILNIHKYTPLASLILSNGITTFGSLGFLYNIDKLSVLIKTNGAIKSFVLEFEKNSIRALLGDGSVITEYDENTLHNSIPLILGIGDEGVIRISRFSNGEYYTSEVPLAAGDMITDLVYYLNKSDQIFSAILNDVWLNENNYLTVDRAKSVLFQLMPGHTNEDIEWVEELVQKNEFKTKSVSEYLKVIDGIELEDKEVVAKCYCSAEKMLNAIKLISSNERNKLVQKDDEIEIKCDFCLKRIKINSKDIV